MVATYNFGSVYTTSRHEITVNYYPLHYFSEYCYHVSYIIKMITKTVSEYDQEIPQSQNADNPVTLRGRAAQPSRDTRKTN